MWSRSLHATADIFASLKANQDEPDLERAMRVGVPTEDGLIEGDMRSVYHVPVRLDRSECAFSSIILISIIANRLDGFSFVVTSLR